MPVACVRGPGHPDQVCDLVAAAIVEEYERRDKASRLHVRVMGGHGALFVAGEVSTQADFDVASIVRRVLGSCGVREEIEPFIALEPMVSGLMPAAGTRAGASVVGYATNETSERVPAYVAQARRVARLLEAKRVSDEEWFWLSSDYEVTVESVEQKNVTVVRVGHASTKPLSDVRSLIHRVLTEAGVAGPIRINPAGEESRFGFAERVGSSGLASAAQGMGSMVPASVSGVGLHSMHPLNLGAALARRAARECVGRELGAAVLVQASWLPAEGRPHHVRLRNERGEDLGEAITRERFDLERAPHEYLADGLLTRRLQAGYLETELPWEKD